jgi:hypothetical protein
VRFSGLIASLFALQAIASAWALPCFDPVDPVTDFEEVGLGIAGWQMDSGGERRFPGDRLAGHDEATGARVDPESRQGGRTGCFMHCPYRQGPGSTFQEFCVRLPTQPSGMLEGVTSIAGDVEKSDGVTYRVLINGTEAWAEHRRGADWKPFRIDLAPWTGQVATVRFEVSPGPANNTAFDWALWGGRRLLLPGLRSPLAARPAPPALDVARLSSCRDRGWAPIQGFDGTLRVESDEQEASLRYAGPDGEFAYVWRLPTGTNDSSIGRWLLKTRIEGGINSEIPLAAGSGIEWTDAVLPTASSSRATGNTVALSRTFRRGDGEQAVLHVTARLEGKALVLSVSCDKPWIRSFSGGDWGPVALRQRVAVPYYPHRVEYLPAESLFVSSYPDWEASGASRFSGSAALYEPLTDGTRHPLKETFIFSAARHIDEVLANIPNPPSPWRKEMGTRTVLDVWHGGSFEDVARSLDDLAGFGVRDGLVLLHVWQRDGYDNGLPAHWPAREAQGGDEAMKRLSDTARRLGNRLALHENYVDYYPNYERFTTNDLSLNSTGGIVEAWYQPGTRIQSFAVKPSAMLRLSGEQSPEIHRRYATTAGYLDVHSCVPPWFHVDQQDGTPGAGTLRSVIDAHRSLWDYGRRVHEGPMTGEGNGHWFWSGWLDGVEAQFGTGWDHNAGRAAPLMVDFNLLRIHPLQINHGQGYYERWHEEKPPWGGGLPMIALDQYRMQEVVFGHAAFVGGGLWRAPAYAGLEHHLVTPVAARHAGHGVRDIRYGVEGGWVDTTAAAKAGRFTRVRVVYDNGLTITANGEPDELDVDGYVLPEFGWIATQKNFSAGTVLRDGIVVDFSREPDRLFANARRARDWMHGAPLPLRVRVTDFQPLDGRRIRFSYAWTNDAAIARDVRCFVHFDLPAAGAQESKIVFQQDHVLPKPAPAWGPGEVVADGPFDLRIPDHVADGRYAWHIGLFDDRGRLPLDGLDDGSSRIRLGDLIVEEGGRRIRFEAAAADATSRAEWYRRRLNVAEKAVDFGFLKTDGAVLLQRSGDRWVQLTWPADGVSVQVAGSERR